MYVCICVCVCVSIFAYTKKRIILSQDVGGSLLGDAGLLLGEIEYRCPMHVHVCVYIYIYIRMRLYIYIYTFV
jgi:hypothetical protein